jgi:hypothetical protein
LITATVSKAQIAAWDDMLTPEEVRALQQEWGHFLAPETDPEAVSKDSTAIDELRNVAAMDRYFLSTMGVDYYVNKERSELISDLGGDPRTETLPYLMHVIPRAGWRSLFGRYDLSSLRRKEQKNATRAFQYQGLKEMEAEAQMTKNREPLDTEDGFHVGSPLPKTGIPTQSDEMDHHEHEDQDGEAQDEEEIARYLQEWQILKPHWHQLVAVHAIIRHLLGDVTQNDGSPGILIADDVGLGKTAVVVIALLVIADLIDRDLANHSWPPIYGTQLLSICSHQFLYRFR